MDKIAIRISGVIVTALLIPGFWRWYDQRRKQSEETSMPKQQKKKIGKIKYLENVVTTSVVRLNRTVPVLHEVLRIYKGENK